MIILPTISPIGSVFKLELAGRLSVIKQALTHYVIPDSHAQELQHGQSTSGGLPEQSVTNTPRTPPGLVLLRSAQTSSGIAPVRAFTLRNAIPVCKSMFTRRTIIVSVLPPATTKSGRILILTQIVQLSHLARDCGTEQVMIDLEKSQFAQLSNPC